MTDQGKSRFVYVIYIRTTPEPHVWKLMSLP